MSQSWGIDGLELGSAFWCDAYVTL